MFCLYGLSVLFQNKNIYKNTKKMYHSLLSINHLNILKYYNQKNKI